MSLKEFWSIGSEYLNLIRTALVMLANFLLVEEWTINGLLLLMALDTLTGSAKAIRLRKNFTFKNLFWGFTTKILVLIIPVTLAILAKGLSMDFKWFVLLVMDVLLVSEAFSIITNVLSIKQKKDIQDIDFVTMLLEAIRRGLWNMINRMLKIIENADHR